MKKTTIYLAAFLLFVTPVAISLAETEETIPFYKLGEMVVTDQDLSSESTAEVHTITAEEMTRRGVRTLDQALELVPGVYVRTGAAGTPRIDIRGLRTRHVKLLFNGIPVKSTYDGQFDPTTIPVDFIAKIKVTTGGGSVLYGTGGSAGIINIITKSGGPGVNAALFNEFGPDGYYSTNATVTGGTDRVDGVVSMGSLSRDAVPVPDDFDNNEMQPDDDRENSDLERQSVFAGLNFAATDALNLGLTLNYLEGENGAPPSTINDKKDAFAPSVKYDRTDDIETTMVQAAFDYTFQAPVLLRGWVYHSQGDIVSSRYDDDGYSKISKKGSFTEDARNTLQGVNLQVSWRPSQAGRLSAAAFMESDDWKADGYEVDKNKDKINFSTDKDLRTTALTLEYVHRMSERLEWIMGGGFHAMDKDGGSNTEDYSAMAGINFHLSDTTTLTGSWNRSIRFPSTKQLYSQDDGNPELDAETINTWEVGIDQQLPAATTLSIRGYIRHADDFIEKNLDDIYQNYEEYRFKGAEIIVTNTALDNLTLTASAAFMTSEDRSPNTEKDELQNRPEQTLALEGVYRFPFGLTAQASLLHVADQYYYSRNEPLEKAETDDYQIVNFRLSQTFMDGGLEVFFRGENLLDELYEQSYGFPAPGRSLYAGAVIRF
jgi:vitamin B12 transporter